MKTILFTFQFIIVLILSTIDSNAQNYCFWIANQSEENLNQIKIRESGTGKPFSDDLIPTFYLKSGEHWSVKTNDGVQMWDVQITDMDDRPLIFTCKDAGGNPYIKQRFITVNAKELHTLIIRAKRNNISGFSYYTSDQLDVGDPCFMWFSENHLEK